MLQYIARRIAVSIPMLLAVVFATFVLMYALPGDVTQTLLGTKWTEETAEAYREEHGLNDPLPVQFARYVGNVLSGDLGNNKYAKPVTDDLKTTLPATIELAGCAMVIAIIVGVSMGILSALRPRGWRDLIVLSGSLAGVSIPIFWLGFLAIRFFRPGGVLADATGFAGLPFGGRLSEPMLEIIDDAAADGQVTTTGFYLFDSIFIFKNSAMLGDALLHLILPAIVLSTVPTAIIVRITRAAMMEQINQDFVRTARAKGVGERRIVIRHVLRNAAIPIITAIGSQLGYLLGGAVLTETIFSWPGMGKYIVQAINDQDLRPMQAGVLIIAVGFVVINLLVDLSYALLDPRVRTASETGGGKA